MRYADINPKSLLSEQRSLNGITVYHGGPDYDGSSEPRLGHPGLFYVTEDLAYAEEGYARGGYVATFLMQMRKPFDLRVPRNIMAAYKIYAADPPDVDEPYDIETDAGEEWALLVSSAVVNYFTQKGYDGFVINESSHGASYAITNPSQLKLLNVRKVAR